MHKCPMCSNADLTSVVRNYDFRYNSKGEREMFNIPPIRGHECHHCYQNNPCNKSERLFFVSGK